MIIAPHFPPEISSSSDLVYELSSDLFKNGCDVTVITTSPRYDLKNLIKFYRGRFYRKENMDGIRVIRVMSLPILKRYPRFLKGVKHIFDSLPVFLGGIISGRRDIIFCVSPPLFLGLSSFALGKLRKIPFIFSAQDMFPQYVIDLGLLKSRFIIWFFEFLEGFIYKKAKYISVHSEGNRGNIVSKGIDPHKVVVIPNWVDTDRIGSTNNGTRFRKENDVSEKFVVSYAGTIGYSQDLTVTVDCAKLLEEHQDIIFLMVGEGPLKKHLQEKVRSLNLVNVKFLPFQPREKYSMVLSGSDICLVPLSREVKTPVVPGKIPAIMASGRSIIAALSSNNDGAKIIRDAKCGYCIEPGNPKQLSEAIIKL